MRGFSLVEFLVGMAILALLAGLALTNLRGVRGASSSRAVAELLGEELRAAHKGAQARRVPLALAIPSQGGTRPHARAYYLLEGMRDPRITRVVDLTTEHPGTMIFAGYWTVDAPAVNTTGAADHAVQPGSFSFATWAAPFPQDAHYVFMPSGSVTSDQQVRFEGDFHLVVCQGVDYVGGTVDGDPFARATRLAAPWTVTLTPAGAVRVDQGLLAGSSVTTIDSAYVPATVPAGPPAAALGPNQDPIMAGLSVAPQPLPATLPPGIDATVDRGGYLTLEVRATDPDSDPLFCSWTVEDGVLSASTETRMEWADGEWVSVWEWRPPPTAPVGARFTLSCTVADHRGGSVTQTVGAAGQIEVIGGGKIFFASNREGNGDIFVMNPDGTEVTNLTASPFYEDFPMVSPDGSRIVLISNEGGNDQVWVMNVDGSNRRQLTTTPGKHRLCCWSPDGTQILWNIDDEVWAMNSDGSGQRQINDNPGDGWVENDWHPGGALLAISRVSGAVGGGEDTFLYDLNGNQLGNLTATLGDDERPRWSPDGTALVWQGRRGASQEILIADFNGSTLGPQVNLTNHPADDDLPNFSPDGQQLLFTSSRSGNEDLFVMDRNGANVVQLTNSPGWDRWGSWSR